MIKINQIKNGITKIEIPNWIVNLIKIGLISLFGFFYNSIRVEVNKLKKLDNILEIKVDEKTTLKELLLKQDTRLDIIELWQAKIDDRNTPKQLEEIRLSIENIKNKQIGAITRIDNLEKKKPRYEKKFDELIKEDKRLLELIYQKKK